MKAGLAVVPPVLFGGTRFVVAGALLLGFQRARGNRIGIAPGDLGRFAAMTLLMIVVPYSLLFWGARFVSSGLAAILDLAFMPACLLGIGALLGEERLTGVRAAGVVTGVCGLLILFGPKAWAIQGAASRGSGREELLGGSAIVLSAVVYAWGSVRARALLRVYPSVQMAGLTMVCGGLAMGAGAVAFEPGARVALGGHWGGAAWAAWVFLVLFGSLVAYTAYLHLVLVWGTARAGAYAFVSPIVAVVLGVWVFGETVGIADAVGMVVMLAGAWLTLRPVQLEQDGPVSRR